MNIGTLQAYLGLETAEFDRKLGISLKSIDDAGKKMRDIGKKMSLAITTPLVGLGVGSFKVFKDFEKNMKLIEGLAGVSKKQIDEWSKGLLDMATNVGKGPKELADALYFISSSGVPVSQAMDILNISAKAATAGLGETTVVANLVTSAMNAYGHEVLSASKATDILVTAVKEGKAEASDLAQSMSTVLPIASEMGVSFEQVAAAMAAMTRTGADASETATSLRGILSSLLKPTSEAEKALVSMGTSSSELRDTLRNQGLLPVLKKLRDLQTQYGEETLGVVITNIRALSGVLDLVGKNMDSNIQVFESMANATGNLDTAFKAASETTEFKWQQSIVRSQKALVQLGQSVKEVFVPILNAVSKLIEWLGNRFDGLSGTMKTVVLVLTTVVAAIGPFLLGLGKIIKIAPTIVTALTAVRGAVVKLNAAILTNPYLALGAAIIAIGTGLYIWYKNASKLNDVDKTSIDVRKRIDKINGEVTDGVAKYTAELSYSLKIAKNEKQSKEERLKAIKKINEISPKYLGFLTLENINTKKASDAVDVYTNSILKNARAKAAKQELVDIEQELISLQLQNIKNQQLKKKETDDYLESQNRYFSDAQDFEDFMNTPTKNLLTESDRIMQGQLRLIKAKYADVGKIRIDSLLAQREAVMKLVESESLLIAPDTPTGDGPTTTTDEMTNLQNQIKKVNADYEVTKELLTDENALQQAKIKHLQDIFELNKQIYLLNPTEDGLQALKDEWAVLEKTVTTAENKLALAEHLDFLNEKAIERSKAIKEAEQGINEEYKLALYLAEDKKAQLQAEYDRLSSIYQLKKQLAGDDKVFSEEELAALKLINDQLTAQKFILDNMKDDTTPQTWADKWSSAAEQVESAINHAMETVVDSLINAISSVEKVNVGQFLLETLADLAIKVGKIAVKTGLAVEGIKKALKSLNPYAALVAGIALIALGTAVKASLADSVQGLATGGQVTKSGAFLVGEEGPELVTLNAGSAVIPNHLLGNTGGGEPYILSTRISGRDLEVIMERAKAQNKRRGK